MESPQHQRQTPFQILDAVGSLFGNNKECYYRILLGASQQIKYLAFSATKHSLPDIRGEQLDIEALPEGNWTVGYLIPKDGADKLALESTAHVVLPSVEQVWCPRTIDYLELSKSSYDEKPLQCMGKGPHVTVRGCHFGVDQVVVHLEWNPNSVYPIDHYTNMFARVDGHDIGPKFLAHVTENHDRVIGYMVERLHGRHATLANLASCRAVLSKLHRLGLLHGALRAESFIIADDGHAVLHDFGSCYEPDDPSLLVTEMAGLEEAFGQEPHHLEPLGKELGDQAIAMLERDGGLHPAVIAEAHKKGRIDITELEHRRMLEQLDRDHVQEV